MKFLILVAGLAVVTATAQPGSTISPGSGNPQGVPPGSPDNPNQPARTVPGPADDQLPADGLLRNLPPDAMTLPATNGLGLVTNQYGTVLTPTTETTNPVNRVYSLQGDTNAPSRGSQDGAITQQDQTLLLQIRHVVPIQVTTIPKAADGSFPINYFVQNGIVRLTGVVPTFQDKQQVELAVGRVPGVVSVVNNIEINPQAGAATASSSTNAPDADAAATAGIGSTNTLSPTSQPTNNSNRIYNLPPGLQRQEELPPGLNRREQLPPGLDRRATTNVPDTSP